ncbi:MAG: alkaline phosphatase family protein [Candidatus Cybelea sp.]
MIVKKVIAYLSVCVLAACSPARPPTLPPITSYPAAFKPAAPWVKSPIKHVVFVIQENRSFNNLFMGYPGALTQRYGYDERHRKIALHAQMLGSSWDIAHSSQSFKADCDGQGTLPGTQCRMDGWNHQQAGIGHPKDFAYAYVPRNEIVPYWQMAKQYVLADKMFSSNLDGSFVAHQYAVAAYANHSVNTPASAWGCEGGKTDTIPTLTKRRTIGPRIPVCFENPTLGAVADQAGLSWRFYAGAVYDSGGLWSSYQADRGVYGGSDWSADVINPPAQFLTDVGNGELANVTWITPTFATSDHPGLASTQGPAWVASIVDAVGESKFWKSTAIFVMWDDWGGWFDPVQPVLEDYDGLGFRVPLIAVSAYAKQGYVTHIQYETSSVLRFIEDNFGLSPLARSDARAKDPATDAFDYGRRPRAFKKIAGSKPSSYWMELQRSERARDGASIIGDD